MSFSDPYLLLALLAVPLAAAGYALLEVRRARRAATWSRPALLPNTVRRPIGPLRHVPIILLLLGLTFLLVGFARPERGRASASPGAPTVVIAFDVSGSMAADDTPPTRIRAARSLAISFLHEVPAQYRVAVVSFSNVVHLLVPPTFDRGAAIAGLPSHVTPLGGTSIGEGIAYAVSIATGAAGESRAGGVYRPGTVLLLSDGTQTSAGPTPEQAAVSALVNYVPVNAVAVGTRHALVTQPVTVNGQQTSTQISVPVDIASLRTVATQSGGAFFDYAAAAGAPQSLAKVYAHLHTFSQPARRTERLSVAAGAVALALVVAGIGLSGFWFGRVA